ncbi:uncharacterized protein METZ01_LOCUS27081 [marine metagenome]|uniref:Thioredoxin domain-containing protein n=1 Tax=marine metagenome TaxID=408172 RepID=A0A381Q855_9ZZZZ
MRNSIKGTLNRVTKSGLVIPALTTVVIALVLACGSSAAPGVVPQATSAPADPTAITPILATTVLEVGEQRLAFLLTTTKGLIKTPTALVTLIFLDGDGTPSVPLEAAFNLWPYGIRGSYSTYANFDRAGRWRLDVQVDNPHGMDEVQFEVEVMENSPVLALGSRALLSVSKTLAGHEAIEEITTDYSPDPDLYQLTVKEAVENLLPSVVVFASPAFCTSPTCGPQVDMVTELKDRHPGEANYIHIEIYDHPAEIQGDLDRAEIFSVVDDWGLTAIEDYFNESWTFIIDADGMIHDRFEGFATLDELEIALIKVLSRS